MRIIDPEHRKDYYDCMQAQDSDKKTLWIRKPITEIYKNRNEWPFPRLRTFYQYVSLTQRIIGFCGKIYPLLEFERLDDYSVHRRPTLCRDLPQAEAYLRSNLQAPELLVWLDQKNLSQKYRNRRNPKFAQYRTKEGFESFFEECAEKQGAFMKFFEAKRSPIFVATYLDELDREGEITYNALLRPSEFFLVFAPPIAYQEILMFMNNLAVPLKPIPKLDDVTMAEAKGFDRFSFRKDPTRKRR